MFTNILLTLSPAHHQLKVVLVEKVITEVHESTTGPHLCHTYSYRKSGGVGIQGEGLATF